MVTTTKMLGVAALMSIALAGAAVSTNPGGATAAENTIKMGGTIAQAPESARVATAVPAGRDPACTGQTWPYVAPSCLVAADGTPIRNVVRTVAIGTR